MVTRSPILERIITGALLAVAGGVGAWALRPAPTAAAPRIEQPRIVVAVSGEVARPGVYELAFGSRAFAAIKAAGGFSARADADLVNPAKRLEDGDQLRVPSRPPEVIPSEPAPPSAEPVVVTAAPEPKADAKPAKPAENASSKAPAKLADKRSGKPTSPPASGGRLLFALPKAPPPATISRPIDPPVSSSNATAKPTVSPSSTASSGWGFNMSPPSPATSGVASSAPEADPAAILARGVNVNTASSAELEALPGIGPALAARIVESRPYSSAADLDRVKGIGPKMLEKIGPYLRF